MKAKIIILIVILLTIICAWAPWLTETNVKQIITNNYLSGGGIVDSPGIGGIRDISKGIFGTKVRVSITSGMTGRYERTDLVFVSFIGTIHSLQYVAE